MIKKNEFIYIFYKNSLMKRLIDETNEYKFTVNDVIKKKDEHFLYYYLKK